MSKLLIAAIRFYQKNISPAKLPCCRFTPSCSAYAIEAIRIHGCLKGTVLAFWRILRCNPLCRGGYDPVPEKKKK
ncbi:MAG: membrane protein insertion efficiency factor YidD [Clostridia bacterium]|nr:membrane protein insertion efficiency factor YidD [Clostridia bacterium]